MIIEFRFWQSEKVNLPIPLKQIMEQVAIMVSRQKVKDVAWKQLTLAGINRVRFEEAGHLQ